MAILREELKTTTTTKKNPRIYKIHKDVEKEKNVCVCVFVCVCVCLCPADYTAMRVALSSLVLMWLTDILT